MSGPVIRRILAEDWPLLKHVRLAALADSPDAFSATLDQANAYEDQVWMTRAEAGSSGDRQATFLLTDQNHGLGMITGIPAVVSPRACQLVSTWVAPTVRGRGYGAQLVSTLVDWATDAGYGYMQLWVTTTNKGAVRLYESAGFTPTGETQPLPSNPELSEALHRHRLPTIV